MNFTTTDDREREREREREKGTVFFVRNEGGRIEEGRNYFLSSLHHRLSPSKTTIIHLFFFNVNCNLK